MPLTPATGTERAARLLLHPMRVWAVQHALRTGVVTAQDFSREWPMCSDSHVQMTFQGLTAAGWLRRDPPRRPHGQYARYVPADLTGLHALQADLTALLALVPTPEVPDETHD